MKKLFLKTLSWRLTATSITCTVSYFITGSLKAASSIAVIEFVTKWILHATHDTMWDKYIDKK